MPDTYETLLEAIRQHSSMDDEQIVEAGKYGADAGWPGFTYTVDGAEFYRANSDEIDELLRESADDMGYENVAQMVGSFSRADMADSRDSRDCLLSWFALEEVGRWLVDHLDDDDDDETDEEDNA